MAELRKVACLLLADIVVVGFTRERRWLKVLLASLLTRVRILTLRKQKILCFTVKVAEKRRYTLGFTVINECTVNIK